MGECIYCGKQAKFLVYTCSGNYAYQYGTFLCEEHLIRAKQVKSPHIKENIKQLLRGSALDMYTTENEKNRCFYEGQVSAYSIVLNILGVSDEEINQILAEEKEKIEETIKIEE